MIKSRLAHSHLEFSLYKTDNLLNSERSNSHSEFSFNKNILNSKRSNSHSEFSFNKNILNSKRSQSAIEFLILTGFLLFSFTIFFVAVQGNMSDKIRERQEIVVKSVAVAVQDEINLASQSMDGYYRQFRTPKDINGKDYEMSVTEGIVYLKTADEKYALALPIPEVTGEIIVGGVNIIRKEDGVVYLN